MDFKLGDMVSVTPTKFQVNSRSVGAVVELMAIAIYTDGTPITDKNTYVCCLVDRNIYPDLDSSPLSVTQLNASITSLNNSGSQIVLSTVKDFDKYHGQNILWATVSTNKVTSVASKPAKVIRKNDFCNCKSCKETVLMAEPNQSDGTFVCWSCRNYPMRNYY